MQREFRQALRWSDATVCLEGRRCLEILLCTTAADRICSDWRGRLEKDARHLLGGRRNLLGGAALLTLVGAAAVCALAFLPFGLGCACLNPPMMFVTCSSGLCLLPVTCRFESLARDLRSLEQGRGSEGMRRPQAAMAPYTSAPRFSFLVLARALSKSYPRKHPGFDTSKKDQVLGGSPASLTAW